jgi:hypothetical protein
VGIATESGQCGGVVGVEGCVFCEFEVVPASIMVCGFEVFQAEEYSFTGQQPIVSRRLVSGGTIRGLIGGRPNLRMGMLMNYLYCDYYGHYSSVCVVRTVYSPELILGIEPKMYRAFYAVIHRPATAC